MPASDNLNGQQFYHGTWAGWLRKGQVIKPAKSRLHEDMGLTNFSLSSPHHVYVTTDPEDAKWYAELGYQNLEKMGHKIDNVPVIGAKPVVYRVQPRGTVQKDTSRDVQDRNSYKILGDAKILGRHWEKND